MNMVVVLEIVVGIFVLAAAIRFAVRDTRQRRGATQSEDTGEVGLAPSSEREVEQPSEVADQREGEEVAALSASSTAPEPTESAR